MACHARVRPRPAAHRDRREYGSWWKSAASVKLARSSGSHAAPVTAGRLRGAGSPSEHDRCISQAISSRWRPALQAGRAEHLVEVLDLAVQRDQFGVHGRPEDLAQQRRGAFDRAVHHVADLHLDAQVHLLLRHGAAISCCCSPTR